MTPWLAIRLELWREVRARWGLLLLAPAALLVGEIVPDTYRAAWSGFALERMLPLLAMLLAARTGGKADAFWRGLRGPAWARVAAFTGLHLAVLLGCAGIVWLRLATYGEGTLSQALRAKGQIIDPLELTALILAAYGVTAAARALVSGVAVILAPILAGLILGFTLWVSHYLQLWPLWGSIPYRMLLLGMAGLALAWWWERRFGAWGAAVKRHGPWQGAAALLAFLLLNVGGEAVTRSPCLANTRIEGVSPDGRRVLRIASWKGWNTHGGRAWLWEDGQERLLPYLGVEDASLGPHGAYALRLSGGPEGGVRLILVGPSGRERQIEVRDGIPGFGDWQPDGTALELRQRVDTSHGTRAMTTILSVNGEDRALGEGTTDLVWAGDSIIALSSGRVLHDDRPVRGFPARAELELLGGLLIKEVVRESEHPVKRERYREGLWRIRGTAAERLHEPVNMDRIGTARTGGRCFADEGDHWTCWVEKGEPVAHPEAGEIPWSLEPLLLLRYLPPKRFRTREGTSWHPEEGWEGAALLDAQTLRLVYPDAVVDLHAEGSQTAHGLRGWGW